MGQQQPTAPIISGSHPLLCIDTLISFLGYRFFTKGFFKIYWPFFQKENPSRTTSSQRSIGTHRTGQEDKEDGEMLNEVLIHPQ